MNVGTMQPGPEDPRPDAPRQRRPPPVAGEAGGGLDDAEALLAADRAGEEPSDAEALEAGAEGADAHADADGAAVAARWRLRDPAQEAQHQAAEAQLVGWLQAIAGQDERALGALYDATVSRVFGIVRRIVRQPELVEEVVEDTFFQVWRQAARFDPQRGTALTWLLSMARSRAIDLLRREQRFRHDPLDELNMPDDGERAQSCDLLLESARQQAELHAALLQLGAQARQLVALAFFRGLTHEEIADQTALPLGTVKSQIRRALASLRQILGDDAPLAAAR